MLQLDEEVEGMQATVLHFDLQLKEAKNSEQSAPKDHTTSSSSSSSSKGSKDRTKGTTNGPVETGSMNNSSTNSKT